MKYKCFINNLIFTYVYKISLLTLIRIRKILLLQVNTKRDYTFVNVLLLIHNNKTMAIVFKIKNIKTLCFIYQLQFCLNCKCQTKL
ncbi:hypothetical protein V1478_017671 [Vespula squamosa]|uniref:Uncharacterized protein n=1 Tax=Vespula squamosa TaxID=30214 RepID=A0ABD1ZX04_VESSQ